MSGAPVVIGSTAPWAGGWADPWCEAVLAPNPSAMTLDGTNTWLISAPGATSALLVDPGPSDPGHLETVSARLEDRGQTVDRILLTHGHLDHSEGATLFAERFGCSVLALDATHRLGSEGLAGGDVVAVGDTEVHVVATPGHSSDSLSFHVPGSGSVLTGDTVLGRGTTVVAHPDGSLSQYLDSLRRLRRLARDRSVHRLLPGHGPTAQDPGGLLDEYWRHRQERLRQVREAVAAGAGTAHDVLEMVYQPIPDAVVPAALASINAQLDHLRG